MHTGKLTQEASGLTSDGRTTFSGSTLFELKSTYGFPLDFALDKIINDENMVIGWPDFIEAARGNNWWDFQTYETICPAMVDAMLPTDVQVAIRLRFQQYVITHPHPNMIGMHND